MGFLSQETRPMAPCILVHGLHGKGKTERAVKGGKPFVIATELKSRNRVRKLNPHADGFFPESLVELEQLLAILGSEKFLKAGFDRLVLDSYTETTNALPDWIILRHSPNLKLDPGRLIEKQEYGPVMNWALAIVDALMLTGLPVIILCRSEIKDGQTVLMSTGSSAKHLSSKVNATFEAIFEGELGHHWTSEPSPSSPRCGLEEVPQKWNGTALDLLQLIGGASLAAPATTEPEAAPAPAPVVAPAEPAPVAPPVPALPEPTTVGEAIAQLPRQENAPVSQAASDFVDGVSPEVASNEEIREVLDICGAHREIDMARLLNYFHHKGGLVLFKDQKPGFMRLSKVAFDASIPVLRDENRRRAFVAHLNNGTYNAPPTSPTPGA